MRFSDCAKLIATTAVTFLVGMAVSSTVWAAGSPYGIWYDHSRSAAVEIKKCGKALCGYIVWVKDPRDAKKGCGKPLIRNVKYVGNNTWDRGLIYSPTDGKDYSVELKPISRSKLKVLGYSGSKFFSKTMYWKRAPDNVKRCGGRSNGKAQVARKKSKGKKTAAGKNHIKTAALTDAPPPVRKPAISKIFASTSARQDSAVAAASVPGLVPPKPVLARRPATAQSSRFADRKALRDGRMDLTGGGERAGMVPGSRQANATDDDGLCTIRVPFVTISVPCIGR